MTALLPVTTPRLRSTIGGVLAFAFALLLCTGCGGSGGETVRVDGSSTVYPLSEAVAEEFLREGIAQVTIGESGTGGGFSKFLRGETDINDASRPITVTERERAQENGIEYIELPVAYDGLAVVANPGVDWVECLSVDELRRIWRPDSDVTNWSQVREGFPSDTLRLFGPGTASGTYDYFTEAIMGESGASRTDFTSSEDDNVLVQGVEGTDGALGYFGYAYYKNNTDRLRILSIDPDERGSGAECVTPRDSTIRTGTYRPLARPLFIYVRADAASEESVQAFVNFYLENAAELASEVGYVPLSDDAYELVRARFANRTTGTLFGREEVGAGADVEQTLREDMRSAEPDTAATAQAPAPDAATAAATGGPAS
jgi:phosphate transport system substrate-binding protein